MDVDKPPSPNPRVPSGAHGTHTAPGAQRLRLALQARIARLYATTDDTLQVGPLTIPFTRITDPNIILNQAADAEGRRDRATGTSHAGDELHLPYWAQLWESSLGMGVFLVHHWAQMYAPDYPSAVSRLAKSLMSQSRRARVLDLGCGMGLTGAVAARLGGEVTFADLEPAALLFARLNSLPHRDRCHYRQLNWRTGTLADRFDLIVGADVLYERRQWEPLDQFFRHHLAPGGAVMLGEPGRVTGDDYPAWITPRGWTLERFAQPRPDGKPIRVFQLTLPDKPGEYPRPNTRGIAQVF